MEYYTYSQAPRLTKYLHLKTLDEKGVFVFYSHTPLMAEVHKSVGFGTAQREQSHAFVRFPVLVLTEGLCHNMPSPRWHKSVTAVKPRRHRGGANSSPR